MNERRSVGFQLPKTIQRVARQLVEQRTRDASLVPAPTPSACPALPAHLWPALSQEKFEMGNSRRSQPAGPGRKQQHRGGQSSAVAGLTAGPPATTAWTCPCIVANSLIGVLVQLTAWNCGVSCEQSFLVLVACFCIHCASDGKQERVLSVEGLVKLRDLCGSVCKKDGLISVAVASAFCLWLGAAYSLCNQQQAARPGAASGVADAVLLFCLSMVQCIVHPIDYLFDILTQ